MTAILERIQDYDWKEAFKYALPHECAAAHKHGPHAPLDSEIVLGFTREDVAEVVAAEDGENDGPEWLGVFRLRDGRFASLRAGCDYTGWG